MVVTPWAATLAGALMFAAGMWALRRSWMTRRAAGAGLVAAGWLTIAAGVAAFVYGFGGEVGTTYALLALSVVAYGAVAATIEMRQARRRGVREAALDPEERPTNWPRAISKSLLAIVLAGIAAIGLGVAFAVAMPLSAPDRIVIGGLLVPILWGGGMAWTLSDAKLVRATLLLLAISAAGYGIAFLPKVLS